MYFLKFTCAMFWLIIPSLNTKQYRISVYYNECSCVLIIPTSIIMWYFGNGCLVNYLVGFLFFSSIYLLWGLRSRRAVCLSGLHWPQKWKMNWWTLSIVFWAEGMPRSLISGPYLPGRLSSAVLCRISQLPWPGPWRKSSRFNKDRPA